MSLTTATHELKGNLEWVAVVVVTTNGVILSSKLLPIFNMQCSGVRRTNLYNYSTDFHNGVC